MRYCCRYCTGLPLFGMLAGARTFLKHSSSHLLLHEWKLTMMPGNSQFDVSIHYNVAFSFGLYECSAKEHNEESHDTCIAAVIGIVAAINACMFSVFALLSMYSLTYRPFFLFFSFVSMIHTFLTGYISRTKIVLLRANHRSTSSHT